MQGKADRTKKRTGAGEILEAVKEWRLGRGCAVKPMKGRCAW